MSSPRYTSAGNRESPRMLVPRLPKMIRRHELTGRLARRRIPLAPPSPQGGTSGDESRSGIEMSVIAKSVRNDTAGAEHGGWALREGSRRCVGTVFPTCTAGRPLACGPRIPCRRRSLHPAGPFPSLPSTVNSSRHRPRRDEPLIRERRPERGDDHWVVHIHPRIHPRHGTGHPLPPMCPPVNSVAPTVVRHSTATSCRIRSGSASLDAVDRMGKTQPAAEPNEDRIEQAEGHGRSSCPAAYW